MDENKPMHQNYDAFVTEDKCTLHHRIMEGQLDLLRQKDKMLEEKISGVETRLERMDKKMDDILKWQADQYKIQIGLLVAVVLTLIGVALGRGIDFGFFG